MSYLFLARPAGRPNMSLVFGHETIKEIAGFDPEELENIIQDTWGDEWELQHIEFFEIGEYRPITFEKQVSYTLNQD